MQSVGDVVVLGRVVTPARAELAGDAAIRARQGEVFTAGREFEVRVQVAIRIWGAAARGVDDEESTSGESLVSSAQPFVVEYSRGSIAIAHNGNLVNAHILRDELEAYGSIFQSTMDTEVIVHLLAQSKARFLDWPPSKNRSEYGTTSELP